MNSPSRALSPEIEYRCCRDMNLYNSPACRELATQARAGRHLRPLSSEPSENALPVRLREDGYPAWLLLTDARSLEPSLVPYRPAPVSRAEIERALPHVIAFSRKALTVPNRYLWGGTLGPDYDCSGLVQAAFAASGIWLPRDSYQQEAFCSSLPRETLLPGDLIFFGLEKVDHVALYLGDNHYIHSSGRETGRNGIGIDILADTGDEIGRYYFRRARGFGRVTRGYEG